MKKNRFNRKMFKQLRESKGLTFLALARELKTFEPMANKNSCWQWERGIHEPSVRYLQAISQFFGVSIDDFMRQ